MVVMAQQNRLLGIARRWVGLVWFLHLEWNVLLEYETLEMEVRKFKP